ncbi:rhamnogalacturonan lyase B N-terminal domain-containing protein [Actinoplanes awajinensis]|uniref:rhamnogalacturonan endolyase n=1 Tax=Actinoplanes awajinensis subsp. mycoplanecinus TaxID=135947 RepID=A0A0X3UMJ6_9ACTN|nr:rhamnogalacturonan lyase B N-terminal domain-containing protein [Actinoplanes awajinensis]KUL33720.1 rhamnogalacturonase B [Actinoplanes awajinensis subsp. mycoplanecinus]
MTPDPQFPSSHRRPASRKKRKALAGGIAAVAVLAGAGLLGGQPWANAASSITFDTGTGLTFAVNTTNGNVTSLKHDGTELTASGQAAGQFESGWSSATVTSQSFNSGASILVSATNSSIGVTQYYFARKNDNTLYMATDITKALNPGEARFITRLKSSLLTTSPVAAKTSGTTSTVEGSDVFAFASGQTASKFFSSQRLIAQTPFGASGNGHGAYIIAGNNDMTSGGPFFRDIEVNDTGTAVNITHYMFSGHQQTEALRLGLHGPYALAVTDGESPTVHSMDFLSSYIPGLLSNAQRGGVTGTASGSWNGLKATVGLAGTNGQYWGSVKSGKFVIGHIKPGTYTATLYAGELAVGTPKTITVTAAATTSLAVTGNVPAAGTLFQLGTFDGTPAGFLNADKIETMHPSDSRMGAWTASSYSVASGAAKFPMAEFKSVNSPMALNFTLASVPANGVKLRIATTSAFAGGRPAVTIGSYSSPSSASPAPANLDSRNVTRGTWRGINTTYTFTVPASALKAGSNTLSISTISGSSGATFLSPNFIFDGLALDPA